MPSSSLVRRLIRMAEKRTKMTVFCKTTELPALDAAAKAAGFGHAQGGRGAWMRQLALDAARPGPKTLQIAGGPAEAIVSDAARDGITPRAWLERAVMLTNAARAGLAPKRQGRSV